MSELFSQFQRWLENEPFLTHSDGLVRVREDSGSLAGKVRPKQVTRLAGSRRPTDDFCGGADYLRLWEPYLRNAIARSLGLGRNHRKNHVVQNAYNRMIGKFS